MKNRHVHYLISIKLHCAPPKCTSVQNYTLWTLICTYLVNHRNTILCVRVLVQTGIADKCLTTNIQVPCNQNAEINQLCTVHHVGSPHTGKKVYVVCPCDPSKKKKKKRSNGGDPYCSQKKFRFCTMVQNTCWWSIMHVDGAQRSSVLLKWCTM